jgi:acetate kinase
LAISPASARIQAYVIPSDEEAIIARAAARLFRRETS